MPTKRWTIRRKAEFLAMAANQTQEELDEILKKERMTLEEFREMKAQMSEGGVKGLRVTRVGLNRKLRGIPRKPRKPREVSS